MGCCALPFAVDEMALNYHDFQCLSRMLLSVKIVSSPNRGLDIELDVRLALVIWLSVPLQWLM